MIRGSDGLEYADLAAILLGEPLDNTFNNNVRAYRAAAAEDHPVYVKRWTKERVRHYIEGFAEVCPEGDPGPGPQFARAHQAGLFAAGVSLLRPATLNRS